MKTSIGKYSKSFFLKLLVGIIILPFIFWGMGDVFRGGNQNIVATVDSEKINTQNFINYLNRLNLNEQARKNIDKSDLVEKILSDYVGKKIVEIEMNRLGINISDTTLKNIITNDENFFKKKKFSRAKYELFLLQSSLTAVQFEQNIVTQEKKRQLLSFLSAGLVIPEFLVMNEFKKENQIKTISYIDLNKLYDQRRTDPKEIKKIYEKNSDLFVEIFKTIKYAKITPLVLTGKKDYDEVFFTQINKIENNVLDGVDFESISSSNNLNVLSIKEINNKRINTKGNKSNEIDPKIFNKIFSISGVNVPELISLENEYYLAVITDEINKKKDITDNEVIDAIKVQLKIKDKLETNRDIIQKIYEGKFNLEEMNLFAVKNNLEVKNTKLDNLKNNKVFKEALIKKIYETGDNDMNLITDSKLSENFVVYTKNTIYKEFDKNSPEYKKYKSKARLSFTKNIYNKYDKTLNSRYNVEINNKAVTRIKNSF